MVGWMLCYVGFLKREFSWEEHADELVNECGGSMILRSMGGNIILMQKGSNRTVKELIEDFDEWISFWFKWTKPWSNLEVNTNRVIWTRWYGVPVHAWLNHFFALACAKLGLFVKMDEFMNHNGSLEAARILISTSCFTDIDRILRIRIDGRVFPIRVVEEVNCSCQSKTMNPEESEDDDSDSQWSDEDGNFAK